MCAVENINHKQLNGITYLLCRQTHNKTFLLSRPTNKYIREGVVVGGVVIGGVIRAHAALGNASLPPATTQRQTKAAAL